MNKEISPKRGVELAGEKGKAEGGQVPPFRHILPLSREEKFLQAVCGHLLRHSSPQPA